MTNEINDVTNEAGDRKLPGHEDRLSCFHKQGVRIGTDILMQPQAEQRLELLYSYRDIMAQNYKSIVCLL